MADRLLVTIAIAARHTALYIYSVPSVLWALLSVQQDQRYCRQTIGQYSNSSNSHTALYIYSVQSVLWALLSVQQDQRFGRLLVTIAIAAIDIQHCTSTVYHLYFGPYCQCNRTRCMADRLLVTIAIDIQHCTSTVYHLYCGPYCQCNRVRGTADRLLVTIATAAIDIYSAAQTVCYCSTVTLSCTEKSDTWFVYIIIQQCTVTVLNRSTVTSSCCTEANNKLYTEYSQQCC